MRYNRVTRRWVLLYLLACIASSSARAQSTEADIKARLLHKPLFLRGRWVAENLNFDSQGNLIGNSARVVFTLAGVDVAKVKLTSDSLTLRGKRVGIAFTKDVPQRKPFDDLSITIQKPSSGDFTQILNAIFVDDLPDMSPFAPDYWQQYLAAHFPVSGAGPQVRGPQGPPVRQVGGAVKPPEVLSKVEPGYNNVARHLMYSGVSTVTLIINSDGRPQNVSVIHPIGLGLDDRAVAAVSQYTFKPAMEHGQPVPVQANIEVNFEIR